MTTNRAVTFFRGPTQWFDPVQLSAGALSRIARRDDTLRGVIETMSRLQPDAYLEFLLDYLRRGSARFGPEWGYTDLLTVLHAAARLLEAESYLEVGVRRGRSMACVVGARPEVDLYGFDVWVPDYAGMENPGPDFVKEEMRRIGHRGQIQLVSGDSHQTLPEFLRARPELTFDIVTVDGDHSVAGTRTDLRQALPRLKRGGVIVLDDVAHPQHPGLIGVWRDLLTAHPELDGATYTELGYGVAFAVRRGR